MDVAFSTEAISDSRTYDTIEDKFMFEGTVISINITPVAEAPMESVEAVRAIPGRGLEGDRYFDHPQIEARADFGRG